MVIKKEGKNIEEFCVPAVLKDYGMQPIPLSEIDPEANKWLN
jgi:hypothetical protein